MDNEIEDLKKQIEDLKDRIRTKESETPNHELNVVEEDEYVWEAPVRIFSPWENRKITTLILWVTVLAIVLLFLHEFLLLILIFLLTLVAIALVIVPPAMIKHKITNKGIFTYNKLYLWPDLQDFWVAEKNGHTIMYINTKLSYPTRLFFVLPQETIKEVTETLAKHVKYYERRDSQGALSRMSDGIYIKFNDLRNL